MRAGHLRDELTLQAITQSANGFGAAGTDAWANLATTPIVRARIVPLSGDELYAAERIAAEVTHRIELRYRDDLTAKMRAVSGARTFDILAVTEPVRRRETHLLVREVI